MENLIKFTSTRSNLISPDNLIFFLSQLILDHVIKVEDQIGKLANLLISENEDLRISCELFLEQFMLQQKNKR